MELDKRIKEGKRPLTCLDVEQARKFEGKLCLFSPLLGNYKNISEYSEYPQYTGILTIRDKFDSPMSEECPYRNGNDGYFYELVLPLEWIEEPEKKYRPYTLEEFSNIFKVGDLVEFRYKDSDEVKCAMFTGYITDVDRIDDKTPGACEVMLGIFHYSLLDLFKDFERFYNGRWWSFGIEVKENEEE